jgi:hypothetical protein
MLSKEQRETLLRPLNPRRVLQLRGQSHLPSYDVVAHLTRIFGFEGWDKEIIKLWLISEVATPDPKQPLNGRSRHTVTYGCTMRLTIYQLDPSNDDYFGRNRKPIKVIEESATGTAVHQPSLGDAHDFAMKNSISYAIKRCAKDLGDQFGLSLYDSGSTRALVQRIVAYGDSPEFRDEVPTSMGNDELQEESEPQDN